MKTNPNELISESVAVTPSGIMVESKKGLTKREYFAATAMQGILSIPHDLTFDNKQMSKAQAAVYIADALIAELNKEPVIEFRQCQKCKGTGRVYAGFGHYETCPMCKGKGGTNHEVKA